MARSSAARAEAPQHEKPKRATARERGPVSAHKEKPPKTIDVKPGNTVDFNGVQATVIGIGEGEQGKGKVYFLEAPKSDTETGRVWVVSAAEVLAGKEAPLPKREKVKPLSQQPEVAKQLREATKAELRQAEDALIQVRAERDEARKRLASQPNDQRALAALKKLSTRAPAEQKRWQDAFRSLNPDIGSDQASHVAAELAGNGILLDAQASGLASPEQAHQRVIQLTDVVKEYEFKPAADLLTREIEKIKMIERAYAAAPAAIKKGIDAIRDPKTPSEMRNDPAYLKLLAKWDTLPQADRTTFIEFAKGMTEETPEGRIYEQFAKDRTRLLRELAEAPSERTFARTDVANELGVSVVGLDQLRQDFEKNRLQTIVGFTWDQFMNPKVEAPKGFFGKLFRKTETVQEKRQKMFDAILETGASIEPKKKAA